MSSSIKSSKIWFGHLVTTFTDYQILANRGPDQTPAEVDKWTLSFWMDIDKSFIERRYKRFDKSNVSNRFYRQFDKWFDKTVLKYGHFLPFLTKMDHKFVICRILQITTCCMVNCWLGYPRLAIFKGLAYIYETVFSSVSLPKDVFLRKESELK